MTAFFDWLQHNKEWLFSGVGIVFISALGTFFFGLLRRLLTPTRSPSLQISLAFGLLNYGRKFSNQMLFFTVANPSDRPAQLTSVHIPMKKGGNIVFSYLNGEKRLPCMIEPGTSTKFWVELSDVESSMRSRDYIGSSEIHAVASDALGNDYPSNSVTVR